MKRALGGNPDIFMKQQPTPQQVREAIAAYYARLNVQGRKTSAWS